MTIDEQEKILDDVLGTMMPELHFGRVDALTYCRDIVVGIVSASLSFPCRIDPRGYAAFSCIVGVRFESVEHWLADSERPRWNSTIATPLHLLHKDHRFAEWKFTSAADLVNMRGIILDDLNKHAVPFIERYSTPAELRKALESPNSEYWFNLGPDRRVVVLAILQLIDGDKAGAMRALDSAIAERRSALPKRRFDIERLQRRLAEVA
jgi:hypothetical protein